MKMKPMMSRLKREQQMKRLKKMHPWLRMMPQLMKMKPMMSRLKREQQMKRLKMKLLLRKMKDLQPRMQLLIPSPKKAEKDPAAKPKVAKEKSEKSVSSYDGAVTGSTYEVVLEAIQSVTEKKGCTVDMIKKFYLAKYPEKDWTRVKKLVKKALEKGLEEGIIIRPKATEDMTGMTGRFKIDKDVLKKNTQKVKKPAEEKAAKPKPKPKKDEAKSKGTAKSATGKKVAG